MIFFTKNKKLKQYKFKRIKPFKSISIDRIHSFDSFKNEHVDYVKNKKFSNILNITTQNTKENKCSFYLKLTQTNFFFTIKYNEKTVRTFSAGMMDMKIKQAKVHYCLKRPLKAFLRATQTATIVRNCSLFVITLMAPRRQSSFLFKTVYRHILKKTREMKKFSLRIICNIKPLKIFNGCRAKKQRNRKRGKFKVIKTFKNP